MTAIAAIVVLFGAVVAAEVALDRLGRRAPRTSGSAPAGRPPSGEWPPLGAGSDAAAGSDPSAGWRPEPANRALMLLGFGVLAVSLFLPFARNEAGCLDHCYDARQWYWWNPGQNLGAPLLLIGVAGAVRRLRPMPAGRLVVRPSAVCGWAAAAFLCFVAPAMVDEFLYGGPPAEILPTLLVAPVGWALLWAGSTRLPQAVLRGPG